MFYDWLAGEVFLILPTRAGRRRARARLILEAGALCEGWEAYNRSMRAANGSQDRSDAHSGGNGRVRLRGFFYL